MSQEIDIVRALAELGDALRKRDNKIEGLCDQLGAMDKRILDAENKARRDLAAPGRGKLFEELWEHFEKRENHFQCAEFVYHEGPECGKCGGCSINRIVEAIRETQK